MTERFLNWYFALDMDDGIVSCALSIWLTIPVAAILILSDVFALIESPVKKWRNSQAAHTPGSGLCNPQIQD